jgi:hypothetical protein
MSMSDFEVAVFWKALGKAKAWERLNDPNIVGSLDTEGFYELCLQAGFSKEDANKQANIRGNARLDQGLKL